MATKNINIRIATRTGAEAAVLTTVPKVGQPFWISDQPTKVFIGNGVDSVATILSGGSYVGRELLSTLAESDDHPDRTSWIPIVDSLGNVTRKLYPDVEVEQVHIYVSNSSGVAILRGSPVYATGASGVRVTVALATGAEPTTLPVIGIAEDDIPDGGSGYVVARGRLVGEAGNPFDTSGWSVGDTLYVDNDGALTNDRTTNVNLVQPIGVVVVSNAETGHIEVACSPVVLNAVAYTGSVGDANWSGSPLSVAKGGTGSTSAPDARTALGLRIGVDVQAALSVVSQAEAEAGTATTSRIWTAQRVAQAIAALTGQTPWDMTIAVSDETTALTTGTGKITFRMPRAVTLTAVRASVTTAPTGSAIEVDINEGGVSILDTVISIDATEKTSTTAATPPVISDASLADGAEVTIDIDQVGSTVAGAGLKVTLIGTVA